MDVTPADSAAIVEQYEVVYNPTGRVCAGYDTREEADAAVAWYVETYGPFQHGEIAVREPSYYEAHRG